MMHSLACWLSLHALAAGPRGLSHDGLSAVLSGIVADMPAQYLAVDAYELADRGGKQNAC